MRRCANRKATAKGLKDIEKCTIGGGGDEEDEKPDKRWGQQTSRTLMRTLMEVVWCPGVGDGAAAAASAGLLTKKIVMMSLTRLNEWQRCR